ncbi:MAG: M20/M25/M40 family metallo-hydrolase [Chloroflexota bacterium]
MAIDRERLLGQFLAFVQIDSPSFEEARFDEMLSEELAALGLSVSNDRSGQDGAGNLLAVLPGTDPALPALLVGTHVDTVEPGRGVKPRVENGVVVTDGTTILGADNKAAVAATLEAIRHLQTAKPRHGDVEFLYTWGEERGLLGAAVFDAGRLRSRIGFIVDSSEMAKIVTRAPWQTTLVATFTGKAAHAGSEPEKGINAILAAAKAIAAMPLGRLDAETTANVGKIAGGTARNAVPENAVLEGEARSLDQAKLERQVGVMTRALEEGAAALGARVELDWQQQYQGYHLADDSPAVRVSLAALRALGLQPYLGSSGGGTDANHLVAKGVPCAVLGIGYEDIHSTREHIAVDDLVRTAQLLVNIVEETARQAV